VHGCQEGLPTWQLGASDEQDAGIEDRAELLYGVDGEIRSDVDADHLVPAKNGCCDLVDGGFSIDDSTRACKELEKQKVDVVAPGAGIIITQVLPTVRCRARCGFPEMKKVA